MIDMVVFCSKAEAEKAEGSKKTGLISITTSPSEGLVGGTPAVLDETRWGSVLRLVFDDVDHMPWGGGYVLFDYGHAHEIIDWLEKYENDFNTVIVHCSAGISRSAAVAKFIADVYPVTFFNHNYTLYNKYVYRVLNNVYKERQGLTF